MEILSNCPVTIACLVSGGASKPDFSMQPFDALSMRAVLAEANPILLNRRVEKIQQISRDEVVISLRSKAGTVHLLVSAQASFGRICLLPTPPAPKGSNPPPFCQLLRKHLTSAILMELTQLPGERVVDLVFACSDELGNRSSKSLTAEIMGRHSNLILWDIDTNKILGASHVVTAEMSRQREVSAGLTYVRPPKQEKPGIFALSHDEFDKAYARLQASYAAASETQNDGAEKSQGGEIKTYEQWLMANFAGLGRHLAEEIVEAAKLPDAISKETTSTAERDELWKRIESIQNISNYAPSMRIDLTKFSVLSWWKEESRGAELWKEHSSANEMIDSYFKGVQLRTEIQQLKDRIRSELKTENDKLQQRMELAKKLLCESADHDRFKKFGDTILAHLNEIKPGQSKLECPDMFAETEQMLSIELNPNVSASQNAQNYYRRFAKARTRSKTASASAQDANDKLAEVQACTLTLEKAETLNDLQSLKEKVLDRGRKAEAVPSKPQSTHGSQREHKASHPRLLSTKSSDGFTILVGRNKQENDVLVSKLAHPHDIWLHAQGLEGAHVLIKLPNKKDPPLSTLKEAAQIAARFAKIGLGGKVKVIYTYGKYVRKIAKDKPGLVRYENEKTLEVDTAAPLPEALRKFFS